jgi:hypothetical protein
MGHFTIARVTKAASPQGDSSLAGQVLNPSAIKVFPVSIAKIEGYCTAALNLDEKPPITVFQNMHVAQQPAS